MNPHTATRARSPVAVYLFGALAELLFGYDTGIIGVAMLSIKREIALTPGLEGLVVSSLLLGAAIGVGTAGRLADLWGRRPAILLTGVIFAVGGLGAYAAPDVWWLIAFRFVMGLGVGASASVVTVYLVEVAPTSHRGSIGALGQLMIVLGILLAFVTGYLLAPYHAWRLMMGLSAIPAVILGIGVLMLPETPRWLMLKGRPAQAREALLRLGRDTGADQELAEISAGLKGKEAAASLSQVLRAMFNPAARRALIGAIGLAVLVQFVGTNSILYFAPTTLVHAGFGDGAAITASLAIGVANVLFTLLGIAVVDKLSRRRLLMVGCLGMITAMVTLGLFTAGAEPSQSTAQFTLGCMILFLSCFAASWGVCVRVVVSELFPASYRGSATGFVLVLNWSSNFVVSQAFPSLLQYSASMSFLIFGSIGVLALLFVWKVLPETAHRTLDAA